MAFGRNARVLAYPLPRPRMHDGPHETDVTLGDRSDCRPLCRRLARVAFAGQSRSAGVPSPTRAPLFPVALSAAWAALPASRPSPPSPTSDSDGAAQPAAFRFAGSCVPPVQARHDRNKARPFDYPRFPGNRTAGQPLAGRATPEHAHRATCGPGRTAGFEPRIGVGISRSRTARQPSRIQPTDRAAHAPRTDSAKDGSFDASGFSEPDRA